MSSEQKSFGEYLKYLIKTARMTQAGFYKELNIGKPYFYDVISGRVNPFAPDLQFKAMEILKPSKQTRNEFYDIAANRRGEMPADIKSITDMHPAFINEIRLLLDKLLTDQEETI